MLTRFRTDLQKETLLLVRDRRALVVAGLIPVLVIWAYSYVEPPAEVRFDDEIFRTTDPTALIVSLAVMFPAFVMGSSAVVREKSSGTLRRLSRTPMHTLEFLGAKLTVLTGVSLLQVLLVLVVAMTTLDNITVSDTGGFILRLGLAAVAFVATGLLVSSLATTEFQALMITAFGVLIMLVLCGFLAPMENLGPAEPIARMLPYTHAYLSSYHFLKGLEADEPFLLYLLADAVLTFVAAMFLVRRFRKD